jgi:DNA-binding transcriptional LysR family regulator
MELRHLSTFRTVAAELSFTRAAAQLGYVQSAVTSHIKALEDELGVRLFDRLGRRIVLTHAGSQLLDYAVRILQLTDEATAMISDVGEPTGPVTVSAPEMLCAYRLPPVIRELHRQHPGIRLVFRANPTGALDPSLRLALANGDVDTAFVLDENLASTGTLSVEHLASEPLVVVTGPQHPLAQAPAIGPADLDGVPVLLTDKGCGYRRVFERALHGAGARPAIAGEFTSGETVKRCVEASTMIGVLARISVTAELDAGHLIALPWNGPPLTLSSYLIAHRQRSISPAHAALRATTRQSYLKSGAYSPVTEPGITEASVHADAASVRL